MGIYIKGFQLPEKSDMYYVKVECEAGKNPVATIWRKDLMGEMSFGAFEVIPISRHGDLIDRYKTILNLRMGYDYGASKIVALQPTIIPAEPPKEVE